MLPQSISELAFIKKHKHKNKRKALLPLWKQMELCANFIPDIIKHVKQLCFSSMR